MSLIAALSLGLASINVLATEEIETYISSSWQYKAFELQSKIDLGSPLREATIPMTHNSYNASHYGNLGSYYDPNHIHSITEQLDMGVRLLELDSHWFNDDILACHGTNDHTGCSVYDGQIEERIGEINTWLRRSENADQVVFIYIEDHLDNHYAEASLILDKYFADKIYTTPSCNAQIPLDISKADILQAGKQVVIYGGGYDCNAASGTNWGNYVFSGFFNTDNSGLSAAPDCSANSFNPSYIKANITRVYEDSTTLSSLFGDPPKDIDADYMKVLSDCGINAVGLDQLDYNDSRHGAAIWSWNINEPNGGNNENCAISFEPNRLADVSCSQSYQFACSDAQGNWSVSSGSGAWQDGQAICAAEGLNFDMPKNGQQNFQLGQAKIAANVGRVWVNYSDLESEGDWRPGDSPELNLSPADDGIVYRQLRNGKGKCLDLEGRSTDNGTSVHQWSCHTDLADIDSQLWYQDEQGRIHSKLNPNRCIDVSGSGTGEGSDIHLWDCHGGANQQWKRGTNNSLRPMNAPHMAMDISGGGNSTDGSDSHLWTYHGGKTQMWYWWTPAHYTTWSPEAQPGAGQVLNSSWSSSGGRSTTNLGNPLVELIVEQAGDATIDLTSSADSYLYLLDANGSTITSNDDGGDGYNSRITAQLNAGVYLLVAATYSSGQNANFTLSTNLGTVKAFEYKRLKNGKGYCMDLEDEGTGNGTEVHQWSCQSDDYQRWYQDSLGRIHSKKARFKCVDVAGAGTGNGSAIHLWSCHGGDNQRWIRSTNNSFRPAHATGKAFDIDGGSTWSTRGSDAHIWGYHGGKTQQWVWID